MLQFATAEVVDVFLADDAGVDPRGQGRVHQAGRRILVAGIGVLPHGMTTSPVLHGDLLILQVDQNVDSYLAAYDKKTGAEKWKVARPGFIPSYATPAIYTPEKGPAQVIVSGSFQVASYSVADGEKLWWVDGSAYMTKAVPVVAGGICYVSAYTVPTSEFGMPPFQATFADELIERNANEDGKIGRDEWEHPMLQQWWLAFDLDGDDSLDEKEWEYMASTETATGGLFAIDMSGKGDVTKTHVKWRYDDRRGLPDTPTPLVVDGTLFMIKDGGLLTTLDTKSGEIIKQGRVGKSDQYYASPVSAGGKIITASLSGQLSVISAQAEWEVLSSHGLEEEIWSTPAIADDLVFIRTQEALYCFFNAAIEDFRFVAIGDVPQETITEISEALEEHRARIVETFGVTDLPTITVKIWQDRPAFEAAYGEDAEYVQGYVDIEKWEVRIFNGRPTLGLSTVHEFTHLVTVALNPTIANNPRWLWEATAIYESSAPPVPDPKSLGCISPSMFPTLDELETHPFNIYRMGYFLTEFIISKWGQEGLNKLIQSNGNVQESLNVTKRQFERDWLEYMISEYDLQYLEDACKDC